ENINVTSSCGEVLDRVNGFVENSIGIAVSCNSGVIAIRKASLEEGYFNDIPKLISEGWFKKGDKFEYNK
ncbi:MAG: hypothetical protein JW902_15450, partial [Syntrophaceae bacterium]|nr:hypothetical protein [Syntrophaceae bacterium]